MHPNPKKVAPIILLIAVAVSSWWYLDSRRATAVSGNLSASGTIEATEVTLAPELAGKVLEVLVAEGDSVQAGQILMRFDDTLLQAQLEQAQAALAQAQANYDLIASGLTKEQRQASIAAAQLELLNAKKALQSLYDNAGLMAAAALKEISMAEKAIDAASDRLSTLEEGAAQADIDAARATVTLLKDQLDKAREDYAPYEKKPEDNLTRAALLSKVSAAQKAYDSAVARLNNLLADANQLDLHNTEADLAVAQAQLADARRRSEIFKNGPDPADVALAEASITLAEAHVAVARADPSAEQLALAQAQVDSAHAALAVIQTQLDKTTIEAPSDGIILTRAVEPGEVASTGAPLLTLARLDALTLTIYLPEDRYGAVALGQTVSVTVDSFPGQTFMAKVVHIADAAEFTPRNVQTAEGRRTTVFAIKLTIDNPEGKLKPGMPADVAFGE